MNRLIDAIALPLPIRNTTQAGTRQQSNATRNNRRLVADNVAKQVTRDNHTVQRPRILHHQHSRAINKLMRNLKLGKLLGKDLGNNLPPQPAGSQHIRLIQTPHLGRRAPRQGQEASQSRDPLDLVSVVGLRIHSVTGPVVFYAVAEVDAARQLTDDDEVGATADFRLERGAVDQALAGEAAGAQVAEGAELLAQTEETLLRSDGGVGTPFWTADGAEEDGVGCFGGVEGFVG